MLSMPLNKPIEKRYFSITEVAKRLKVNASQLRYWEKEFHQLKPRTNARGKRFYTESDVQIIEQVRWLVKNQGFTIEGARKAMRKRGEVRQMMESDAPETEVVEQNNAKREELLNRLKKVREQLLQLQSAQS